MALDKRIREYHSFEGEEEYDEDTDEFTTIIDPRFMWRRCDDLAGCHIGIELEVEHSEDVSGIIDAMPSHGDGDGIPPMFEEDGSLNEDTGIEIIFPPLRPATLRDPNSYFSRSIRALSTANLALHDECGMHYNVNTCDMSAQQIKQMCVVFLGMTNEQLMRLGGRYPNGFCNGWDSDERRRSIRSVTIPGNYHDYAVEVKGDDRVEMRFPVATTDTTMINNLVTVFELAREWAIQEPVVTTMPCSTVPHEFLSWLRRGRSAIKRQGLQVMEAVLG